MHIPDGYLSPSTCAGLYAGAAPFWYVALRRVKKELDSRTIPLLSMFSAFSFVIMMFNLPLPGGTTGHAVGMGVASIVLGPWVSMLAISIALWIQALLFGDGGITAFGANCFNMAIVGSLVASGLYRVLSHRADITSRRRIFAAGFAGYGAMNAAAFCAAVEFGIQPLFFRDASGAPLYAPYPLSVSIPAMMIGHLTFAGLAELILSAGMVAYFQRADPAMLRRTAPGAPCTILQSGGALRRRPLLRHLWLGLGLLLILTPLGIVTVGSAWGEWHARSFSDAAARREIAAASGKRAPPTRAPYGLERLSSIWKAPFSDYAPSFVRNASLGYFVAAVMGTGTVVLFSLILAALFRRRRESFLEATVRGLASAVEDAIFAEDVAQSQGVLQTLEPRAKLAGMGALLVVSVSVHRLWVLVALFGLSVLMAALSNISIRMLASRIWIAVLAFTGVIALPAVFLVPGRPLFRIPLFGWSGSDQGVTSAVFLIMRAETAATLALLLVLSTPWNRLLRAVRFFRIPIALVVMIEGTYRFVFVLLQMTRNMFESRSTRLVGRLESAERRRLAVATAAALLDRSLQLSGEVHAAMQARGFRGEAMLLEDLRIGRHAWVELFGFLTLACAALWAGR